MQWHNGESIFDGGDCEGTLTVRLVMRSCGEWHYGCTEGMPSEECVCMGMRAGFEEWSLILVCVRCWQKKLNYRTTTTFGRVFVCMVNWGLVCKYLSATCRQSTIGDLNIILILGVDGFRCQLRNGKERRSADFWFLDTNSEGQGSAGTLQPLCCFYRAEIKKWCSTKPHKTAIRAYGTTPRTK